MKKLTAEETKRIVDKGDATVINVLSEENFEQKHIPGSINVPLEKEDFLKRVEKKVSSRKEPVVVYCANTDCDASPKAAKKLEQAGFEDVRDFEGGVAEWEKQGFRLEGKSARA